MAGRMKRRRAGEGEGGGRDDDDEEEEEEVFLGVFMTHRNLPYFPYHFTI